MTEAERRLDELPELLLTSEELRSPDRAEDFEEEELPREAELRVPEERVLDELLREERDDEEPELRCRELPEFLELEDLDEEVVLREFPERERLCA